MQGANSNQEPAKGREQLQGVCDRCDRSFHYYLIHSGFNDSYYAYCNLCGKTAILDLYSPRLSNPRLQRVPLGRIPAELDGRLGPCACGGRFVMNAGPRCPHCRQLLSAMKASPFIEVQAEGTKKGWRWQGTWEGIYWIVVENRSVRNNFL